MKTAELIDQDLDSAVAVALGWKIVFWGDKPVWVQKDSEGRFRCNVADWHPSTNPAQAWPIIEQEGINTDCGDGSFKGNKKWSAHILADCALKSDEEITGPTLLIAAMRCFVAAKIYA